MSSCCFIVFLFNATATTEIYTYGHTLSLHDSLPICLRYAETAGFVQAPVLFPATRSSFRQVVPVFRRPSDQSARQNPFQHQASRQPWRSGRRFVVPRRSEEHTSELQSLMRISYAVFCLKKKTTYSNHNTQYNTVSN